MRERHDHQHDPRSGNAHRYSVCSRGGLEERVVGVPLVGRAPWESYWTLAIRQLPCGANPEALKDRLALSATLLRATRASYGSHVLARRRSPVACDRGGQSEDLSSGPASGKATEEYTKYVIVDMYAKGMQAQTSCRCCTTGRTST